MVGMGALGFTALVSFISLIYFIKKKNIFFVICFSILTGFYSMLFLLRILF